jgi:hypothetical protein
VLAPGAVSVRAGRDRKATEFDGCAAGILPSAFSQSRVEEWCGYRHGGQLPDTAGRRTRDLRMRAEEPDPGRVLTESYGRPLCAPHVLRQLYGDEPERLYRYARWCRPTTRSESSAGASTSGRRLPQLDWFGDAWTATAVRLVDADVAIHPWDS